LKDSPSGARIVTHAARILHATHDRDGGGVSRPPRRRRDPALLRARYRTLFFLLLTLTALALGHKAAAAPAAAGALMGLYSVRVARSRPAELAHTFVVLDWALLGIALALSGGAESWLLLAVPFLVLGQLAGAPRGEWVFLAGPSLLLVVILAIADPTLAGSRALAVAKVAVLVAGGCVAATRLRRRPAAARRREQHAPMVDVSTGLSTATRLPAFLEERTAAALAEHRPLSVVYVRLEHFEDSRNFLGAEGSEELVRGVARRTERRVGADGRVFRVRPDSFVLVLPGLSLAEARQCAADLAHDVSGSLIGGRRQTLATGASSFPTVRSIGDLLAAARDEALPAAVSTVVAGTVIPLAAAQ
jgi:GGDEF domain-containing protein